MLTITNGISFFSWKYWLCKLQDFLIRRVWLLLFLCSVGRWLCGDENRVFVCQREFSVFPGKRCLPLSASPGALPPGRRLSPDFHQRLAMALRRCFYLSPKKLVTQGSLKILISRCTERQVQVCCSSVRECFESGTNFEYIHFNTSTLAAPKIPQSYPSVLPLLQNHFQLFSIILINISAILMSQTNLNLLRSAISLDCLCPYGFEREDKITGGRKTRSSKKKLSDKLKEMIDERKITTH